MDEEEKTVMKRKQWLMPVLCMTVLILLLGLYLGMKNHSTKDNGTKKDEEDTTLIDMKSNDIINISFDIEGHKASFTKKGDSWVIDDDPDLPIDSTKLSSLINSVAGLKASRTIKNVDNLEEYGLLTPENQISLKNNDDKAISVHIGMRNKTTSNTYINVGDSTDVVYMVSPDLSALLPASKMDLVKNETYPSITDSNITKIEIQDLSNVLTLDNDEGQWYVDDNQNQKSTASSESVGALKTAITGLKFDNLVDYSGENRDQYGLKDPSLILKVHYYEIKNNESNKKDGSKESSSKENNSSKSSSENQEKIEKDMTLNVGNIGSDGSYYVQIEGSNEVHSLAAGSLDSIINQTAQNYWNKSMISLRSDQLNSLTVDYKGVKNKIEKISKEEKDKKGNASTDISYKMDGKQIDSDTFDVFFNKLTSIQAQKKDRDLKQKNDPEMTIMVDTEKGVKQVFFSIYDENFYMIVDDEGRPGLVSKTTIKEFFHAYEEIK